MYNAFLVIIKTEVSVVRNCLRPKRITLNLLQERRTSVKTCTPGI